MNYAYTIPDPGRKNANYKNVLFGLRRTVLSLKNMQKCIFFLPARNASARMDRFSVQKE
jgi:hypothetical protein